MASSNDNYPWPSTLNISNFVSVGLKEKGTSTNYKIWRVQMLCLLKSQDLLGFINGKIQMPECRNGNLMQRKHWRRTDTLVKGWILSSMGEDVLNALVGLNTTSSSKDVWDEVANKFGHENGIEDRTEEVDSEISNSNVVDENGSGNIDFSRYVPLHQAAITGNWEEAKTFFNQDDRAFQNYISPYSETALHVSVKMGEITNNFVQKLLELMSNDAVALQSSVGTALHVAALVGNKKAATMLVNKNRELLFVPNKNNLLPVHLAAKFCGKDDVLKYLIGKCKENVDHCPFVGEVGFNLLCFAITSKFLDVALDLVQTYPQMAMFENEDGDVALNYMAGLKHLFPSGECVKWRKEFSYRTRIPLPSSNTSYFGDIENRGINSQATNSVNEGFSHFKAKFWTVMEHLVPAIKCNRQKKVLYKQAIELFKYLCKELKPCSRIEDVNTLKRSLIIAAKNGIHEVVELIEEMFPLAICRARNDILRLAIQERHENVFNAIYRMNYWPNRLSRELDSSNNELLHMSAKLAPLHKLDLIPGPALQMQRELLWFQQMESIVIPSHRTCPNEKDKTPRMLFTEEHKDLKREAEKWMKGTAKSCSITSVLIATVAFSAVLTVPGGKDTNTGFQYISESIAFFLFFISDITSLFASLNSLIAFLAILTSPHAEEDFLEVLPRTLSSGLLNLRLSIACMIVAFLTTACLTFGKAYGYVYIACCVLMTMVNLCIHNGFQFSILVDLVEAMGLAREFFVRN